MAGWEIIRQIEESERYAACAAALAAPEGDSKPFLGSFGRHLYRTYFPLDSLVDASVALCHRGHPIALVEAVVDLYDRVTRHGEPLRIVLAPEAGGLAEPAVGRLLAHLVGTVAARPQPPDFIEVEDAAVQDLMSPLGLVALKGGGHPLVIPWPTLDLRPSEAVLWQAVRPSFRSNIKWGERHLRLVHFNREAADPAIFERCVAFLAENDRVLQPTTAACYRGAMAEGRGEATLVLQEDRPVGCVFVIDDDGTGYYAVAAARAAGAVRPSTGHWPLWSALCRAKARGCHRFELYRVFFRGQERPGYRFGAAHFKLGFTAEVRQRIVWRIPVDGEALGQATRAAAK